MSTNYYIRRTKPILTFPEFHIGKRSYGWRGLFEANSRTDDVFEYETERPVIHSLDDIRSYVESGEWEIVDEYEERVSYERFVEIMTKPFASEIENGIELKGHSSPTFGTYIDRKGNEWTQTEFS